MGVHQDTPQSATWRTQGYTTLVIERNEYGRWRATQNGVDAVGHGETAQRAAANYCLAIAEVLDD